LHQDFGAFKKKQQKETLWSGFDIVSAWNHTNQPYVVSAGSRKRVAPTDLSEDRPSKRKRITVAPEWIPDIFSDSGLYILILKISRINFDHCYRRRYGTCVLSEEKHKKELLTIF